MGVVGLQESSNAATVLTSSAFIRVKALQRISAHLFLHVPN